MGDDKKIRGPEDRSRISLGEDYEARYWTEKLGISKAELEEVVRNVGSSANAVEQELRRKTLGSRNA